MWLLLKTIYFKISKMRFARCVGASLLRLNFIDQLRECYLLSLFSAKDHFYLGLYLNLNFQSRGWNLMPWHLAEMVSRLGKGAASFSQNIFPEHLSPFLFLEKCNNNNHHTWMFPDLASISSQNISPEHISVFGELFLEATLFLNLVCPNVFPTPVVEVHSMQMNLPTNWFSINPFEAIW